MSKRKKICIYVGFYPLIKGGAEYQARLLTDNIRKYYDVFYISVSNNHKESKMEVIDGYKVYCLTYNLLLNKLSLYWPLGNEIYRILDVEKPDIIYQRVLTSVSHRLGYYSVKNNVPFYIHVADKYSISFQGISISVSIRRFLFYLLRKCSPRFITQNDEQTLLLSSHDLVPVLQVNNMHPSVSIDLNESLKRKINTKIKKVVWIGNARPVKQLELFLDTADTFSNDTCIQFVVIGKLLKNSYGDKLEIRMAAANNVQYFGEKDNDFINKILETDVYLTVNTSSSEGFSNVFIQSWLRGVPVVSLNSNPDGLFDKYDVGKFCENSVSDMKNYISLYLTNSDNIYQRTAMTCRSMATDLFSITTVLPKILHVL